MPKQLISIARIGEWAFLAGVLLAIVLGLFPALVTAATAAVVFVILGIIIGLLNIAVKEIVPFLVAAIALLVAGASGLAALPWLGDILTAILTNIVTFVAPATIIVALKAVIGLARKK